jgi:hypothetical protein
MKKLVVLLGCVLMGSVFLGCSTRSSSSTGESYTTVTFKGAFSGDAGPSGFSPQSADDGSIVVMQNQGSKRVYLAEVKDNEFEFDGANGMNQSLHTLDSDTTHGTKFMAMLLNTDLEVAAVAIKESDADNAHTGIVVSKDVTVAVTFDLDAENKVMKMTNLDDSEAAIDTNYKVRLSESKPAGMNEKFGKTTGGENKPKVNPLDRDEDGRPDIFDGMNDGKVLDNTDITNKTEAKTSDDGGVVESSIMFMNLKKNIGDVLSVTDDASVVLEVVPKEGKAGSIKEIKVAKMSSGKRLVHKNYEDAVIAEKPEGFSSSTYPDTMSGSKTWKSEDYKLYEATNIEGVTVFTVLIKPENNDFKPGDLIVLEVTTTSETTEYYFSTINFKFTDIPVDTSTWGAGGSGALGTPYKILDTGGRVFSWTNPVDEDGVEVSGMEYRFELFHYKAICADKTPGDQIGNMVTIDDRETGVANKNDISESEIDAHATAQCLQVDITAHFPYGDNAAQILHIERQKWSE